MKLNAIWTLLRCALLSSVMVASADLHRHRPGSHSQPTGYKNIGPEDCGDVKDNTELGGHAAANGLSSADDGHHGDGGEYNHGYPPVIFEDDAGFDVPDNYESKADQYVSSHSGHYSQGAPMEQDKVPEDDASIGSGSLSDATIFQEHGVSYGTHDIYKQDSHSPTIRASSLSTSNLASNLPDGSPESTTAATASRPSDTTIGVSTTTIPNTIIIDPNTSSTGSLPSATETLCPGRNMHCVDGFLIGCAAVPNLVDVGPRVPKRVPGVTDPQTCHQSCVEDPLCTAWEDTNEPLVSDGGCYHYSQTSVLNSTEPSLGSLGINSFGIRGFCDLAVPDSIPTTPVTTILTSSQSSTAIFTSSSTSDSSVTIPTSETNLCPQLDGQCLNSNLIRCGRDLDLDADPEYSNYNCLSPLPAITSERECHESCLPNFDCIGWKMTQVLTEPGASECCHVMGYLELQDPLPQQLPIATSPEYKSYGLRFTCSDGRQDEELCPRAENSCLDNFLIKCDRFLFDDLTPATANFTFDWHDNTFSQLGCHQACASDPTCTAWGGYSEPLDSGEGGGELFDCYHVHTPVVLQSPLPDSVREPDPGSAPRYGVRGACA